MSHESNAAEYPHCLNHHAGKGSYSHIVQSEGGIGGGTEEQKRRAFAGRTSQSHLAFAGNGCFAAEGQDLPAACPRPFAGKTSQTSLQYDSGHITAAPVGVLRP
jgi:hypothetical protein